VKVADKKFSGRLHARLLQNSAALETLESTYCIDRRTISRFRLGLSEPYPKSASLASAIHANLLVAPVARADGGFNARYIYRVLPSISTYDRIDGRDSWCVGAPETYFSRKVAKDDSLIVCDNALDLWALVALMRDSPLESTHVVITSSHGDGAWPAAWDVAEFWTQWKRVIIAVGTVRGSSEPDQRGRELSLRTGRDVYRLVPQGAASWREVHANGLRTDQLRKLIKDAAQLRLEDLRSDDAKRYSSASAEDVSCAYLRGYLFEALRVIEKVETADGFSERLAVVVVRSDRTQHKAKEVLCPPLTPNADKVYRLEPDGCLLRRLPVPSRDSTWRWPSASAFLHRSAVAPSLAALLQRLDAHLRASVWLPYEADFLLLSCTAVVTYCQQIFDAVPLILVNGERGSGKTELAIAMSQVCANCQGAVGLISAASLVRLSDETHGFVVIDDLERAKAKRGDDPRFSEIVQTLKLSYKKRSAQKVLIDINHGNQLQSINFFGVKLITNTSGVDDILGSRMLTIATRAMPSGTALPREGWLDAERLAELRDDLHTWAFSHVDDIVRTYVQILPNKSTRENEIFAPLRVVAQLSGLDSFRAQVETALGIGRKADATPTDVMREAILLILLKSIQTDGCLRTVLTVVEVQMRMELLEGGRFGKSSTTDISDIERPEWIGRQFRQVFARENTESQRFRMYDRGVRAWAIHPTFLDQAILESGVAKDTLKEVDDPKAFCQACASCDYRGLCDMQGARQTREATAEMRYGRRKPTGNRAGPDAGIH